MTNKINMHTHSLSEGEWQRIKQELDNKQEQQQKKPKKDKKNPAQKQRRRLKGTGMGGKIISTDPEIGIKTAMALEGGNKQ